MISTLYLRKSAKSARSPSSSASRQDASGHTASRGHSMMTPEGRTGRSRLIHGAYVGGKESRTHAIWRAMIARCCRSSCKDYPRYGGRGVIVHPRWRQYSQFIADMGEAPDGLSIDRIDNRLGYQPGNCRWATHSEQQKNKRTTRRFTDGRFAGTLVEVAAHLGKSKALLCWRWGQWRSFEKEVLWCELPREL